MLDRSVTVSIDEELCSGCGNCARQCPAGTISMVDKKAKVTGSRCISCDHCFASCPEGAVTVASVPEEFTELSTLSPSGEWVPFGEYDAEGLVDLMRSRRSCRHFSSKPVDPATLEDLVKIAISAPSGSNHQMWTFSLLADPGPVKKLSEEVREYFRKLNDLSAKAPARFLAKIFLRDKLNQYYQAYYEHWLRLLHEYDVNGRDLLFHNAPATIVVGSKPGGSSPGADAFLATQNILLAAHAMGLGTCLIGFAVEGINRKPHIKKLVGMPEKETAYAVIAIGYSREKYHRPTGRLKPEIRLVTK